MFCDEETLLAVLIVWDGRNVEGRYVDVPFGRNLKIISAAFDLGLCSRIMLSLSYLEEHVEPIFGPSSDYGVRGTDYQFFIFHRLQEKSPKATIIDKG